MMHRNIHAKEALARFARTGATLPKPVAAAAATRARVSEHIQATHEARQQVARSVYKAFASDTVDSEELAAIALRNTYVPLLGLVEQEADNELTAAVTTHADALVTALRDIFDPLARTLTEAHAVLGDVDIRSHEDHQQILSLGARGVAAWAKAIDATERIQPISHAWKSIAAAAGWRTDIGTAAFSLVKWDAARWLDTRPDSRASVFGSNAWEATRDGWTLYLYNRHDLDEFDAAVGTEEERRETWRETQRVRSFPGVQLGRVPAATP